MFVVQVTGPAGEGMGDRDAVCVKAAGRRPDHSGVVHRKDGVRVRYLIWHEGAESFGEAVRMRWRLECVKGIWAATVREYTTPARARGEE